MFEKIDSVCFQISNKHRPYTPKNIKWQGFFGQDNMVIVICITFMHLIWLNFEPLMMSVAIISMTPLLKYT